MIIGIGTDLVDIGRVRDLLARPSGARFAERVLTPAERQLAGRRERRFAEFVAGRFAAKEAVAKAVGCGIGGRLGFQDIEVLPDSAGKPRCTISPEALERLGCRAGFRIHISITHSETTAAAFAVAEEV